MAGRPEGLHHTGGESALVFAASGSAMISGTLRADAMNEMYLADWETSYAFWPGIGAIGERKVMQCH